MGSILSALDVFASRVSSGKRWSDTDAFFRHLSRAKRLRRRCLSKIYRLPDTGLFGLTRLRTHILICGFPAAGTTLLQLMLENGLPHARRFGREVGGWRAATYSWRNHAVMISKVPHDLFRLEPLRRFYAGRSAELKVILMQRDPRDLMTATRRSCSGKIGYCGDAHLWERYYRAFIRHRDDPDTMVVRYEDLVANAACEQARIEPFVGEPMAIPFSNFNSVERPDFDQTTLCGLRPLEQTRVCRWSLPEHRARIREVLSEVPSLSEAVLELGYETTARHLCPVCGSLTPRAVAAV
jgi:hypothetical protein